MDRVEQRHLEAAGLRWYEARGRDYEDPPIPAGACRYCEGAGCPDCRRDRGQANTRGVVTAALWLTALLAVLAYGPDAVCAVNGEQGPRYCEVQR